MAGLAKGGLDVLDHAHHGNYGAALFTVMEVLVTESLTGGLGTVADIAGGIADAKDCLTDANSTEYQGRGRPRNSDYNHNGYHK